MTDLNVLYTLLAWPAADAEGRALGLKPSIRGDLARAVEAAAPKGEPRHTAYCADQAAQALAKSSMAPELLGLDGVNTYQAPLRQLWAATAESGTSDPSVVLDNVSSRTWMRAELLFSKPLAAAFPTCAWNGRVFTVLAEPSAGRWQLPVPGLGVVSLPGWDGSATVVEVAAPFNRPMITLWDALAKVGMPWHSEELRRRFDRGFELKERVAAAMLNILRLQGAANG